VRFVPIEILCAVLATAHRKNHSQHQQRRRRPSGTVGLFPPLGNANRPKIDFPRSGPSAPFVSATRKARITFNDAVKADPACAMAPLGGGPRGPGITDLGRPRRPMN